MTVVSGSNPLGVSFPDNWLRSKIGRITTKVGSGATPKGGASVYQATGMALIRSLNVHNEGFRSYNLAFINDDHARQLEYASVEPGDVLLNITGASILRSAVAPAEVGPARVNQHVSIVRPDTKQVLPGYLHAWLISPVMHSYMCSQSVGSTREAITKEQILRFPIVLPSIEEQRSIIFYLDSKTTEIDGLIEKMAREVELLERYRREVSWEALTGGLEKASHKVDSEVDWIGLMPESWTTIPGRHLFEVVKRIEPGFSNRVLSITQKGIVPKDLSSHFGQLAESYDLYQRVDAGDYAMNSMDLLTGWVDRSAYDGVTSPDYRVFRLRRAIAAEPRYFTHVLQMGYTRRIFYRYGQGVSNLGRWRLQPKVFLNMRFPLPPLNQQRRIADYIEEKYAEIDSTIADINKQIELLVKYRKQVINDAVTGKVRVGEVA